MQVKQPIILPETGTRFLGTATYMHSDLYTATYTWVHTVAVLMYTVSCKKHKMPNSCSYLCQILTDFRNSFTATFSRKFAIKRSLQISAYLKGVATLSLAQTPCSHKNDVHSVADSDRWSVKIGLQWFDIHRSGTQTWWNLLLWLASVTTVAACHTSSLWRVNIMAKQCPSMLVIRHKYFTRQWSDAFKVWWNL